MPQVVRFTASPSIWIYPRDHAPPHFHLIGPDTDAMIDLRDCNVIAGTYRRGDLRIAVAWASRNAAVLARIWSEQHDRS